MRELGANIIKVIGIHSVGRPSLVGSCLALAILLAPWPSTAQTIFLGEREAFTANTGIGRTGSTGGAIYNPGGLATLLNNQISASGTAFRWTTQEISGTLNTHNETLQSIPTQITSVWLWNDYRVAFSIFVPTSFDTTLSLLVNSGGQTLPARMKLTANTLLVGPSIALPINEKLRVGVSVFVRKYDSFTSMVMRADDSVGPETSRALAYTETQISAYTLMSYWGVSWSPLPNLTIGSRVIGPSVPLSGSQTTITQSVGHKDDGSGLADDSNPEVTTREGYKAERPYEWGIGILWEARPTFRVLADTNYTFEKEYRTTARAPQSEYASSFGTSVGCEIGSSTKYISFGGVHNMNPDRNIVGAANKFWGLTSGYTQVSEHIESSFGLSYLNGNSDNNGIKNKFSGLGVMLSTAYKF